MLALGTTNLQINKDKLIAMNYLQTKHINSSNTVTIRSNQSTIHNNGHYHATVT